MNIKRMRGRNHRPNGGGGGGGGTGGGFRNQQNGIPLNRNHVFDSSGPEMRVRGTAQQLHEKYIQMARDASSSGDRVTGEAYYQHAEHYFRIINAINQAQTQNGQPQNGQAPNGQIQNVPPGYNQGGQNPNGQAPQQGQQNGYGAPQNEYRRPPQQHNGNGNGNGNGYLQEPQDAIETRGYEPRQNVPRQEYQDRRIERPRDVAPEPRPEQRPEQRFEQKPEARPEHRVDRRIDISSALEAELEAAVAPAVSNDRPEPAPGAAAPQPVTIPIAAAAPQENAGAAEAAAVDLAPRPRPRGRPRLNKPVVSE